jgi:polyisoprenoid-binding protein YceI
MTTSDIEVPADIPGYVAGTWTIDPAHSHVGFIVRHLMVSKVRGGFAAFEGKIVTGDDILDSSVTVSIELDSISTTNDYRDEHLRSAEFFDSESYPTMTYTSTGVRYDGENYLVDGELTLRGITKPVTLTLEPPAFGPNPHGGTKAGFSASAEINRMDFGVSYNGPIPGGGVALGEKVQIVLDIEADLSTGD